MWEQDSLSESSPSEWHDSGPVVRSVLDKYQNRRVSPPYSWPGRQIQTGGQGFRMSDPTNGMARRQCRQTSGLPERGIGRREVMHPDEAHTVPLQLLQC